MTEAQIARLAADWSKIAGELVRIEEIKGIVYGFASELGTLRLYHKYQNPKKCRAGYSANLGTFYFSLDLPHAA